MTDLDTLRAVHTAAAMQADHVADLWRVVRAGVAEILSAECAYCGATGCHGPSTTNGRDLERWERIHPGREAWTYSQADIARALGISRQRVGQLASEPVDEDARTAWQNLIGGSQ